MVVQAAVQTTAERRLGSPSSFSFVDPSHGWAAADRVILTTADGGLTWTQLSELDSPVTQIDFVSAERGWAVAGKRLLVTGDGGKTWSDTAQSSLQVDFIDEQHGWLTDGRSLLQTADGGQGWQPIQNPCDTPGFSRFGFAISLISPTDGWAACGGQPATAMQAKEVYRTRDGGATWELIASTGSPGSADPVGQIYMGGHIRTLFFLDEQRGWLGMSRGVLLRTTDGGSTWQVVEGEMATAERFVSDVQFFTPDRGFVAGLGILFGTADGGRSFTPLLPPLEPASSFPMQALDTQHWLDAGTKLDGGVILETEDGGRHWRELARLPGESVGMVRMVDAQTGWVLASHWSEAEGAVQTLYQTTDGGATWNPVQRRAGAGAEPFSALSILADGTLIGASGMGSVYVSDDGGRSFIAVDGDGLPAQAPQFISREKGWRIRDFALEATTDGGRSWTPVGLDSRVLDIEPLPDGSAWVLGGRLVDGRHRSDLLFTPDSGKSWIQYDLGEREAGAVRCATREICVMAADEGLYTTQDGGAHWIQVQ